MSGYGTLFERLGGEAGQRVEWKREDAVLASVASHLSKMLSTRAGSVQTQAGYGLPDLNDMRLSLHDALTEARGAIERFISVYEPRLRGVKVTALPRDHDKLRLSFRIDALLETEGLKRQVSFAAQLNGSGQVNVDTPLGRARRVF